MSMLRCIVQTGILVLLIGGVIMLSAGVGQVNSKSSQESWVIEQLSQGRPANLLTLSDESNDRILSAEFMSAMLIASGSGAYPSGIIIEHAIVPSPVQVLYRHLTNNIVLSECQINGSFELSGCTIDGSVSFTKCSFDELHMSGVVVHGNMILSGSTFNKDVYLPNAVIDGLLSFKDASFLGAICLRYASIGNILEAQRVKCTGIQDVDFAGLKVCGHIFLNEADINGNLVLRGLEVEGSLNAMDAIFHANLDLKDAFVEDTINIKRTSIQKETNLVNVTIGKDFAGMFGHYGDSSAGFVANGLRVGGTIDFHEATFGGAAYFARARVGGALILMRSVFLDASVFKYAQIDEAAIFAGVKTNKSMDLSECRVGQDVFLEMSRIGGELDMTGTQILGSMFMEHSIITHNIKLNNIWVGEELEMSEARVNGDYTNGFKNINIAGSVNMKSAYFGGKCDFYGARIGGDLVLQNTEFVKAVIMKHLALGRGLDIGGTRWAASIEADGMEFKRIRAYGEEDESKYIKSFAELVDYNREFYRRLEYFFKQEGRGEDANDIYVRSRQRERAMMKSGVGKVFDLLLDKVIGYGRSLDHAVGLLFIFWLTGLFVFRRSYMKSVSTGIGMTMYSATRYSLDNLIPILDLDAKKMWTLGDKFGWQRKYLWIHRFFGLLLVTLLIAAWTRLIR